MTKNKPALEPTAEEEAIFAKLCAHYVQRADARQQSMGLQYTEAETHDLARFIARLNTHPAQAGNALAGEITVEDRREPRPHGHTSWHEVRENGRYLCTCAEREDADRIATALAAALTRPAQAGNALADEDTLDMLSEAVAAAHNGVVSLSEGFAKKLLSALRQPVDATDAEGVAALVHDAMVWAAKQGGEPKPWQNGNSTAEGEARRVAGKIAALSRTTSPEKAEIERLLREARAHVSRTACIEQAGGYPPNATNLLARINAALASTDEGEEG